MKTLWLDTETFNSQPIKHGLYRYAESPDLEVILFSYAIDDGEAKVWDCTKDPMPAELHEALSDASVELIAHNAQFDRVVLAKGLNLERPVERWLCSMVKLYAHGLPGSLDEAGRVLGLSSDQAKLKDGKKLITTFCKPAPKNHKAHRYDRHNKPEEWERFKQYAINDIVAMREIVKRCPDWNFPSSLDCTGVQKTELDLWHLDQRINERGFYVDSDLCAAGVRATLEEKAGLKSRFQKLTNGALRAPTQREKFRVYMNETYGLELENTQSATFQKLLAERNDLPADCRELAGISIQGNKSSTAKFASLHEARNADSRFRGGLQFNGAARTRRYAGRVFQPQNLPSRFPKKIGQHVTAYIEALKEGTEAFFFPEDRMLYGSAALRGVLTAPEGKTLRIADLSNIEGRITAWFAGADWKIRAFEDYDFTIAKAAEMGCHDDKKAYEFLLSKGFKDEVLGHDIYRIAAAGMTGMHPSKVPDILRNGLGKPSELGLGYQGGVNALRNMLGNTRMHDKWDEIKASVDAQYVDKAYSNWSDWGSERAGELDKEEWVACETVKLAWRAKNQEIVQLWYDIDSAAINAVRNPGAVYKAGPLLKYVCTGYGGHKYLLCQLPSGRLLCYFSPRISGDGKVTYMGYDTKNNRRLWLRRGFYGGIGLENAAQSIAGDILKYPMPAIEADGLEIVLSVHDELICEDYAGDDDSRIGLLIQHMTSNPKWAKGLPLSADGFTADRYRK